MAGNSNSGKHKDRLWRDALNLEANREVDGEKQITLAAKQLMVKCLAGDVSALKEFGDRLDGKPPQEQQIDITETKTVIRAPSQEASTAIWARQLQKMESNTISSGNPNKGHKLNS
jgi:hypothetical protein